MTAIKNMFKCYFWAYFAHPHIYIYIYVYIWFAPGPRRSICSVDIDAAPSRTKSRASGCSSVNLPPVDIMDEPELTSDGEISEEVKKCKINIYRTYAFTVCTHINI